MPGEIHLDLMRSGRLEEPLVSLNAKKSRWPEKRSWWFVKNFEVSESFLGHERQQLVFDGRYPVLYPGKRAGHILQGRELDLRAYLSGRGTDPRASIWLLVPYRKLSVPNPDICITVKGKTTGRL